MTTLRNPMTTFTRSLLTLALVGVTACGEDTVVSPTFGAGCNVGSIAPGQTKTGALTEESCTIAYHFYSNGRTPYESYSVHLTQGKGYLFYEAQIPDPNNAGRNDVDGLLTLWGKNEDGVSVPLALSDDDADGIDGHDSQIWFIAPTTGDYQLVAASYWGDEFGGYRLEAHECPVVGTVDTAGTYRFALTASPCIRTSDSDTLAYVMIGTTVVAGHQLSFAVDSAGFTPHWEGFGLGFDTYDNIYEESASTEATGSGAAILNFPTLGGQVTYAIGGTNSETTGGFRVAFGVTLSPAPAFPVARSTGQPTMRSSFPSKTH